MKKGQVSIVNLLSIIVTVIIYCYMLPVINPIITSTVATLNATPNEFTPLVVLLLDLIDFAILAMIVVTGFNYAIPHQER